ncbi:MAG: Mov34/MPN/PAD-1 family protein [Candidatus Marinamargulisbacteria bacterium]
MDNFSITERHYNIIIDQVKKNYPYESGGFVGGKDGLITAIFPVLNQDISNKTDVFAIYPQDIERAHLFFDKHGLTYYGTYHSHPKGEAIPSQQDLTHIQKYLFIISLKNFNSPDFAAYKVVGHQKADRIPLKVVSDTSFDVKDIHNKTTKGTDDLVVPTGTPDFHNTQQLNEQVNNLFEGRSSYQRSARDFDDSGDFSTLA